MSEEVDDFKPRNYQVALREIAIKKNSIIYLPTGSGKTFIAILVLKHLSQAHSQPYSQGGKISFIVVNSVALVDQHAKCVEQRTTLKVGRYSGDMSLDFWPKTKWYEEFDKYNVFVMTIQILVNLTNQNFIDLNKVILIVFDECHRGVNDQPMRQLCKSFENLQDPPRILGLTATLLNRNCKINKVITEVQTLEVTYHSQVVTVDGLSDVIGYSTNPTEKLIKVSSSNSHCINDKAIAILQNLVVVLRKIKSPECFYTLPKANLVSLSKDEGLKNLINLIGDITFHIETMGMYGGSKAVLAHIIQIERLKQHCSEASLHMILCYVQTFLNYIKKIYDNAMSGYSERDKIMKFSTDKIIKLISIFDTYQKISKEELCTLIFTKRRFTAKVIYYILDSLSESGIEYSFLKSNFVVGYNHNPFNDTREGLYISKKNREIIQSFDNKEINVLVASNVLEEGVDITTCSLVIKYDYPEEYRSYIQSKGRARNKSSLYFMMVEDNVMDKFVRRYDEFQAIERTLHNLLVGKNETRPEPSIADIQNMYQEDELPPYYVGGPNSAKVDMVSAISLLCSYCNSLPCDKYTNLAPEHFIEKKIVREKMLQSVIIYLPTICPIVDPIKGPFMNSAKSAKRAAALKACELLHKAGELDDHLLPKKYECLEEDTGFLFKHYPAEKESMAGTQKNKRLYKKQIPKFLKGVIQPNQSVYLHIIQLQPEFQRREELNQSTFYDIYTSDLCYGFITPQAVPSLADFPIYVSLGTLNVNLKINIAKVVLTVQDINDIREFNIVVISDILRFLREFLIFDNGKEAESMLLVPVNKELACIDFNILRAHIPIKNTGLELTSEERLKLKVTQESYLQHIVSPWYRDMGDYLVTEVALTKDSNSVFPNEQFATYKDYYHQKHGLMLLNPGQPLLFVKSLSSKWNFIKPLGLEAKKKKQKNYEELEIHLIPELVIKQEFPSALWVQAHLLPTIISRLSFMFRLEEFRMKIVTETHMGKVLVPSKKPLQLDLYLLDYVPSLEKPREVNVLVPEPKEDMIIPSFSNINVNKDYAKKMLEMEYPWKDTEEPKDIERDLDVTVLDINYYEKFLGKKVHDADYMLKNEVPKKQHQLALTYFKNYVEKPIQLLDDKNLTEGPELCLIYKAMTTVKANDIVNMERLETLGDSFLKMFASIYIYLKFPNYNEGLATNLKGRLVSNKNLYYLAVKKNIGGIMKTNDLQISDWLPPGFKIPDLIEKRIDSKKISLASLYHFSIPMEEQISGQLSQETKKFIMDVTSEEDPSEEGLINDMASFFKSSYIGDKTISDCVEALLGVYFQTCGIQGGIKFMEWMNIIPSSENFMQLINRPAKSPILNDKITFKDIIYHIPNWKDIEDNILGYQFKNRAYLLQALTHSSYTPNRITQSYEKLEFIGDAILDFLITCHIFETCGNLSPGELTDLRSALVNNNTFASLVVRCNLHKHLLLINNKLQNLIDRFTQYIESKKYEIDDEVLILLEENDAVGLNLADYIDVPKVLGDVFEAIAGAVYLDSGKDFKVVWKVFHRIMWKEIENFSANVPKNLIRRLYEWTPNLHPKFGSSVTVNNGKVMVPLQFMLNGRRQQVYGFGSNKNLAKKAAAKLALRQLH